MYVSLSIVYNLTDFVVCFPLFVFFPISPISTKSILFIIFLVIDDFPTPLLPEKAEVLPFNSFFRSFIPLPFLALT